MQTSERGIALIEKFEGVRLTAYPDPGTGGEPWTVGYGHTSSAGAPAVTRGMTISQDQADMILRADLAVFERAVLAALARVPNQNQFDAMVSLCFNIGAGNFRSSTVVRRFNAGDFPGAADAFRLWTKAAGHTLPGLIRRREDERALFLTPASAAAQPTQPVPIPGSTSVTLPPATASAAHFSLWGWLKSIFSNPASAPVADPAPAQGQPNPQGNPTMADFTALSAAVDRAAAKISDLETRVAALETAAAATAGEQATVDALAAKLSAAAPVTP